MRELIAYIGLGIAATAVVLVVWLLCFGFIWAVVRFSSGQ